MDGKQGGGKGRMIRRAALGLVLLLALFVILTPVVAGAIAKGLIEDAIEESLNVDATVAGVSVSLTGSASVEGVRLVDAAGRDAGGLERFDASIGLLKALRGTYAFEARVSGLALRLYEEADGGWSAETLPRERSEAPEEEPDASRDALRVFGTAELIDATVVLVRRDGQEVRAEIDASATFNGPDSAAALTAALEFAADARGIGRLAADAALPGDPTLWKDPLDLNAEANLAFEQPLDLAPLAPALRSLLPVELRAGLLGGAGELTLAPGLDVNASAGFTLDGVELLGPREGAAPTRLARVRLDATTEPGADGALAPRVVLRADDALEVTLEGALSGAGTDAATLKAELAIDGDAARLGELASGWVALREGLTFEGALVGGGPVEVALRDGALARAGGALQLGFEELAANDVVRGPVELGPLADASLSFEASFDALNQALDVPRFALIAGPIDARGSAGVALAPELLIDAATVDTTFDLDALAAALEGVLDLGANELAGKLDARLNARGAGGELAGTLSLTADHLRLFAPDTIELEAGSARTELALSGGANALLIQGEGELLGFLLKTPDRPNATGDPGAPPEPGIALDEPRFLFDLDATVSAAAGDLDLRKLHLESQTITGDVQGRVAGFASLGDAGGVMTVDALQGDLTYVPDRLAAALGSRVPGELTGGSPEPCRFQLDGSLRALDAAAFVEGLTGTVDVGVGRYRRTGLDIGGEAHLALTDGRATLASELSANGGEMKLDGALVLTPEDGELIARDSFITLGAEGVGANSELGPLLGFVHPLLAGFDGVNQTELGGIITCDVDLRYEGELSAQQLVGGWEALPKEPINGSITFALDAASIEGSPLIKELLGKLDLGGRKDFVLAPATIEVQAGRVRYAKPWRWTVRGAPTTFGGSIGLDKSLDLSWSIPITDEVIARNDFLQHLRGQTLELPIRGTITRPELTLTDAFKGAATDLAKTVLKEELRGALDSLKGTASDDGDDPAALLKRADKLWKEGDKPAAAELYKRIRKEHKVSLVYALNRDRIKERGAWKP